MCDDVHACANDILTYMESGIPQNMKRMLPIGIAKDGHRIFGPYKNDGTLW